MRSQQTYIKEVREIFFVDWLTCNKMLRFLLEKGFAMLPRCFICTGCQSSIAQILIFFACEHESVHLHNVHCSHSFKAVEPNSRSTTFLLPKPFFS